MVKMDFDYRRKNGLILYHLPVVSRAEPEEFSLNAEPERATATAGKEQNETAKQRRRWKIVSICIELHAFFSLTGSSAEPE